jgi:dinuclear metal center YbgI/SA1388 family protein
VSGVPLLEIVTYLDDYLHVAEVPDSPGAINGLQVENDGTVNRIVAAVDASQRTIDGVADGADRGVAGAPDRGGPRAAPTLLLVHHGLLWDGNVPITGRRYRRLRSLMDHNIALYAAHIPLDVHPEVGNNVVLAERLGVKIEGWFGQYRGIPLGVHGQVPHALESREVLREELGRILDEERGAKERTAPPALIPGGPERVKRIGIITGAAGSMVADAKAAGLDTFITGEGNHHTWFDADEWGINLLYAGHYATETLGVQALASHLSDQFDLPWEFHDHPTGL